MQPHAEPDYSNLAPLLPPDVDPELINVAASRPGGLFALLYSAAAPYTFQHAGASRAAHDHMRQPAPQRLALPGLAYGVEPSGRSAVAEAVRFNEDDDGPKGEESSPSKPQ